MRRLSFTIELLEDVVFSARAASTGGHESLDYIPGAAIVGVASALYRLQGFGPRDPRVFDVLHSGKVRFGPGYPLSKDGRPALPLPLSLHAVKGEPYLDTKREPGRAWIIRDKVWNHSMRSESEEDAQRVQQPVQLRSGFLAFDRELIRPYSHLRMKTRINEQTGRAQEAQLFGYQALAAGQRFVTTIDIDDAIEKATVDELIAVLEGERRMGRSRSAEYGLVDFQSQEKVVAPWSDNVPVREGTLTLWLLSDAHLVDRYGQPTFDLSHTKDWPADLTFDAERSSIRHRSFVPFNGHRRHAELEHHLLSQGGVLCFRGPAASNQELIGRLRDKGIGIHRERGYGRVWVNPPMLGGEHLPEQDEALSGYIYPKSEEKAPVDEPPLVLWTAQRSEERKHRETTVTYVDHLVDGLERIYGAAKALSGSPPNVIVGPGASQWHRIGTAARNADDAEALKRRLFDGDHAICRAKDPDWQIQHSPGDKNTFRDWVEAALFERKDASELEPIDIAIAFSPKAASMVRELRR